MSLQVDRERRARFGLIGLLFALAAVAWAITGERMRGMDDGPGTDPGALGFFLGVWVVMMAAMMFPSVSPTVALQARMQRRRRDMGRSRGGETACFVGGYLLTWTLAGIGAYLLYVAGRAVLGGELAWDGAGRWVAGGTIAAAAVWQLTPYKDACLRKCRSPLGLLLGTWEDGRDGALRMGIRAGAWCVGCCWGLMATLFALGVMSLAWMALVAGLIALEKTLPWARVARYGTTVVLAALAVAVLAAPDRVPGLTVPDQGMATGMGMEG